MSITFITFMVFMAIIIFIFQYDCAFQEREINGMQGPIITVGRWGIEATSDNHG